MNTSPFSEINKSIKKIFAELNVPVYMFSDQVRDFVRQIDADARRKEIDADARRKEIERLEAEAMERKNAEASMEAVPFDVMLEKMEEFDRECRCITRQEAAMFWNEDAQLFSEKMAARQNEVVRAMENESARQAMKRRKLLYSEGGFPEGKEI